ncbi:MAG: SDR family oxidoreductase [Rhodospirillales bacterium]|nr:SDR family oxidoreductase [Rhodospirillales bacterium]
MRFTNKVAVITAAANGIGRAAAQIMVREGATVIAVDNHQGRLDEAVPALRKAAGEGPGKGGPGRVEGKLVDAQDAAEVDRLVADVARDHGRIDILVNAVGGSTVIANPQATTEQLAFADWQKLIAFNLDGTFLFTHAVIPVMKRQRGGKIVNLASIAGRGLSRNSSSAYAAAKGGIIAFTRKLAYELGPEGINVNAIAPSVTLTERIRPHWQKRSQASQAEEIERTPLRRVAEAVDQANVICFLASSDADFVTGLTIDVTGGV